MPNLFRTILVPHDGSEHATRALRFAAALALQSSARLVVLRAIAPFFAFPEGGAAPEDAPWIPPEEIVAVELKALERTVRKAVAGRSAPAIECRVVIGDPYSCILDAAAGVDLVVMATHGRTGLEHLVIGSVAEKVVRHSPAPVLTIRRETAVAAARGRRRASRAGRRRAPASAR